MPSALEEKDAIREVLAEYCFRLDGGDYDGMAALFTADGTWDTAFGKGTGHAGIAQQARDIRANRTQVGAGDNRPRRRRSVGCSARYVPPAIRKPTNQA